MRYFLPMMYIMATTNSQIIWIVIIVLFLFFIYNFYFVVEEGMSNVDPNTHRDTWMLLQNAANDLCLDLHYVNEDQESGYQGDWAILSRCNNKTSQLWKVTPNKNIVNYTKGACLEPDVPAAPNGANIGLYYCDENSMPGGNETWEFLPQGNGSYKIRNSVGTNCLDIQEYNGGKNSNVLIWPCNGGSNQNWYFVPSNSTPQTE
jgi:hypothetical protein